MRNLPETVHEYNIPRLNVIFVISSLILLGSVAWLLKDDYQRGWKPYQRQAKLFERQKLIEDRAAAQKRVDEGGFADLTNRLVSAKLVLEQKKSARQELENKLRPLAAELSVKEIQLATEKAMLDQRKSELEEALEHQAAPSVVERRRATLHAQQRLVEKMDLEIQQLHSTVAQGKGEIVEITGENDRLEKELRKLVTERELLESRLREIDDPITTAVRDAPLIEFAKPTIAIKQIIADNQTYSLNFVDVPRIDRCVTCHAFAEKKDSVPEGEEGFRYSTLPQPWRSHPRLDLFLDPNSPHPMEKFGCSTCHHGWDRGVTFVNAAHTPPFRDIRKEFAKIPVLEGQARWIPRESAEKWKPGLTSKIEEHDKLVQERTELIASGRESTRLEEVRKSIQTMRAEIQKQYGFTPDEFRGMKLASMTPEAAWHAEPLNWHKMHHKEDPMRPREFIESSCLKCHQNVTSIPTIKNREDPSALNPGDKLNAGLLTIERAGCYACHPMKALETTVKRTLKPGESLESLSNTMASDSELILAANGLASAKDIKPGQELNVPVRVPFNKPGPTLEKISSKTSKEWMLRWLENPKEFRPNTYMPRFWNLDNNRNGTTYFGVLTDEEGKPRTFNWTDRNAVEMNAITEYIYSVSTQQQYPAPPAGDILRGKELVDSVGCMGCHVVDQKIGDLAFKDRLYRTQGPMLAGSGSKYDAGWLFAWLKEPSQYRHNTRMPNLRLTDKEAADITAFLMSLRNENFEKKQAPVGNPEVLLDTALDYMRGTVPHRQAVDKLSAMSDAEKQLYLGEKLVQRYGCMNCHNVKGMENAKPISIDLSTWASKAPNKLDFGFIEMPRTTYHFLHQKLMAPRSLDRVEIKRPQELMIMPQYDFSEEQMELIMTAVLGMTAEKPNALARRTLDHNEWLIENGRWLVKELNCVGCHINEGEGGAIRRTMDDEKAFLYPPSLDGVGTKVRSDWLHSFIRRPGDHLYRYWLEARMPTYTLSDTELNTLTQYFALRDKQPYPYEASMMDKEKVKVSKEMLDAGEKLVDAFRCLSCHAARSPEQGRADPSVAVNLNHVKERMRVDGLYEWLKNPAHVTPGVAMPAFWVEDQPSPLTDILGGDSKKQIEAVKQYLLQYNGPATLKSSPLPPAGSAPAGGGSAPAPAPEPAVSYE